MALQGNQHAVARRVEHRPHPHPASPALREQHSSAARCRRSRSCRLRSACSASATLHLALAMTASFDVGPARRGPASPQTHPRTGAKIRRPGPRGRATRRPTPIAPACARPSLTTLLRRDDVVAMAPDRGGRDAGDLRGVRRRAHHRRPTPRRPRARRLHPRLASSSSGAYSPTTEFQAAASCCSPR